MSSYYGSVPQEVRPATARVLVTELSASGNINPTPAIKPCEDSDTAVELYLSPEKLVSQQKCLRIQLVSWYNRLSGCINHVAVCIISRYYIIWDYLFSSCCILYSSGLGIYVSLYQVVCEPGLKNNITYDCLWPEWYWICEGYMG